MEVMKLLKLQNEIDLEIQRQAEANLANFVKSLRFEIGGHSTMLGGFSAQLTVAQIIGIAPIPVELVVASSEPTRTDFVKN
jgi:hypothetical protein